MRGLGAFFLVAGAGGGPFDGVGALALCDGELEPVDMEGGLDELSADAAIDPLLALGEAVDVDDVVEALAGVDVLAGDADEPPFAAAFFGGILPVRLATNLASVGKAMHEEYRAPPGAARKG
jgi:hypothetical protein